MGVYVLKFSACLFVFWLVYVLLLEKQKMHRFKRFYLLAAFAGSLIIPLLSITYYIEPVVLDLETAPSYIPITSTLTQASIEEAPAIDLETILWYLYGFGVLLFSTRFVINLVKLYTTIAKNKKVAQGSFIYVLLKAYRIPHSFFRYIFLNQSKFESAIIPREVLLHEETHAKQLHSLDIIILELLQILFWFHPLVYILKHHVKLNHEFLADEAVLNEGTDTKSYQTILLQFSSSDSYRDTRNYQLSSAINYSSFKKRFTVMKTHTSKTRIWLSTILLLPIFAMLFYGFAEKEYIEKDLTDMDYQQSDDDISKIKYSDGATESMMQEYKAWIKNFEKTRHIDNTSYRRIVAIYDIMTDAQRKSVTPYPVLPSTNLSKVEPKKPTPAQLKSWKNEKEFAIWIDGKYVPNAALDNYKLSDFVHYNGSKVYKNARSQKFPQPFQFHLYTKQGFKKHFKEYAVSDYRELTEKYAKAVALYLKGSQTNNAELKILKAQADKLYNQFTKDELESYKILPAPPVPAEQRTTPPKSKSKGGPNFEDTQEFYNPSFLEYIIEMEQLGASFYLDGEKITPEAAKAIAKNNKGKRTDMTTQKDKDGHYLVKLSKPQKNHVYARSIELKILDNDSYVIDGIKATKKTFMSAFNQIHQDITPEVRNKIMNIHVSSATEISNKEVWFIYNSLQAYGFYRIVTPNQIINRAKGNTPFAIVNRVSAQEKATKEQISTYNKIARHYNDMIASGGNIRIQMKDVEKLKYIYGLMSETQRKNAEPFPDFPEPPPAPSVPEPPKVKVKEVKAIKPPQPPKPVKIKAISRVDEAEVPAKALSAEEKKQLKRRAKVYKEKYPEKAKKLKMKTKDGEVVEVEEIEIPKAELAQVPPPPPPPPTPSPLDFVIKMAKTNAIFYYDSKQISSDKAIALLKKNPELNLRATKTDTKQPVVYISKLPIVIEVKDKKRN